MIEVHISGGKVFTGRRADKKEDYSWLPFAIQQTKGIYLLVIETEEYTEKQEIVEPGVKGKKIVDVVKTREVTKPIFIRQEFIEYVRKVKE